MCRAVANSTCDETLLHRSPGKRFPKFPRHTQAVERPVRVVTENARDGLVRTRLAAKMIMSTYETKRDFVTK